MTSNPPTVPADVNPGHQQSLQATELSASLTVRDLPASLAWYRDVLGFEIDRAFEHEGAIRAVSLRAGRVRLLLTQDDGAKGENRLKGAGFSLQITTPQDIDAIARRVKERGQTLDTDPTDAWGRRVFRLHDPDGFKLVISSPM